MRRDWFAWPIVALIICCFIFGPTWLQIAVGIALAIVVVLFLVFFIGAKITTGGHTR